jgi:hypothetical protein
MPWPTYAGIVDRHVQAAKGLLGEGYHRFDL